jgi:hypothetical protein
VGIFDAFCRERIAISINLVRLRAMGIRSPSARSVQGVPGVVAGRSTPPAHGTRSGQHRLFVYVTTPARVSRQPRPVPSRLRIPRPVPAGESRSRAAGESNLPTLLVGLCVGGANFETSEFETLSIVGVMAQALLPRHRCRILPAIATMGSAAPGRCRPDLPSPTILSRAITPPCRSPA